MVGSGQHLLVKGNWTGFVDVICPALQLCIVEQIVREQSLLCCCLVILQVQHRFSDDVQ